MSKELIPQGNNGSDIIFYTTPDGAVHIEVFFQNETFWLSQKKMADLFGVEVNTINYHLKEIFKSAELQENSVIRKTRITAQDGKNYLTNFYNLDAFLQFNEYEILKDAGKIRHDVAVKLAEKEYEKFRVIQDKNFVSDFDKEVKKLSSGKKDSKGKKGKE